VILIANKRELKNLFWRFPNYAPKPKKQKSVVLTNKGSQNLQCDRDSWHAVSIAQPMLQAVGFLCPPVSLYNLQRVNIYI
jgi:hypothetical protein